MRYNSTIIPKKKKLACGCYDFAFSNNMCKQHATVASFNKRLDKLSDKMIEEDNLGDLIKEADALVSMFVRLSACNDNAEVQCYTCPAILPYQQIQTGHYISRGNMMLRYDVTRNLRPQCVQCNCYKHGNLATFAQNLERDMPGLPDILQEESAIIYKISRDELKGIISEYSLKVKKLKKKISKQ
jgi:hypothetical protein